MNKQELKYIDDFDSDDDSDDANQDYEIQIEEQEESTKIHYIDLDSLQNKGSPDKDIYYRTS